MKNTVVTIAMAGLSVERGRAAGAGDTFESAVIIESGILPLIRVVLWLWRESYMFGNSFQRNNAKL
jgi:hypothetical protein